jgi:hypothetical protein
VERIYGQGPWPRRPARPSSRRAEGGGLIASAAITKRAPHAPRFPGESGRTQVRCGARGRRWSPRASARGDGRAASAWSAEERTSRAVAERHRARPWRARVAHFRAAGAFPRADPGEEDAFGTSPIGRRPAGDEEALRPAVLGLDPGAVAGTGDVGTVQPLGDDALEATRIGRGQDRLGLADEVARRAPGGALEPEPLRGGGEGRRPALRTARSAGQAGPTAAGDERSPSTASSSRRPR